MKYVEIFSWYLGFMDFDISRYCIKLKFSFERRNLSINFQEINGSK